MLKFAITGNIASGKSEMERILEEYGYVVLDTDLITHDILTDTPNVANAFLDYDIFEYGRLSKQKLGKLVFGNPDLKEKLEEIVHPMIKNELKTAFNVYKDEKAIFVSVPLLFEVGWENIFDKTVFISINEENRLERLMKRNNLTKEEALLRINSQTPEKDKLNKADYIIENNSTKEEFRKTVINFITEIK